MLDSPNELFREAFKDTVAMALYFEAISRGLGFISIERDSWCVLIKLFDADSLYELIKSELFYEYGRALEIMGNFPDAKGKFVYSEFSQRIIHSAEQMVEELKSIPLFYEVAYLNNREDEEYA